MTIWRDDVVNGLGAIGDSGSLEEIYNAVKEVRSNTLPKTWQSIIRRELEHNSSDSKSFKERFDLFYSVKGIGNGYWGLRGIEKSTPIAVDIKEPNLYPKRTKIETYRILRDTQLARRIKKLHENRCQVCGKTLILPIKERYSEAHHIKPLGAPHNGPDIAENIIVLCPNHHVQCDYGAIALELTNLEFRKDHKVGQEYVDYHNKYIFNQSSG